MYRKATLNDCEKIYSLICDMECKQLPFDKFYSIYQKQLNDRHYYCLVYEYGNDVIGVLNLRIESRAKKKSQTKRKSRENLNLM